MYTPRSSSEIVRDLMARMVARTTLTDVAEGSVLLSLLQSVAEQIAESEVRLADIRDQFTLEAEGVDLDERAEEIGITRLPSTRATGIVRVTRESSSTAFTVPRGSVFGRTDNTVTYSAQSAVLMGIGVHEIDVAVTASVTGSIGNAPARAINVLIDVPEQITALTQANAIGNGQDQEDDSQLRARTTRYLNSLARCQPIALEYVALSYTATDGTRATTATLYESPTTRGVCELLIDDGSGLGDHPTKRSGAVVTTTLNSALGQIIGVESPIVDAIVVTDISNQAQQIRLIENTDYIVHRERGLIHLLDGASVQVGTELQISGYEVYTGLVAEIQSVIEGDPTDVTSGHRPAGVSVRVLPAPVQRVDLDIQIVVVDGANITTVTDTVETTVASLLSSLDAGAPIFIAKIIDVVMNIDDVINVKIYRPSTRTLAIDQYPQTTRHVLRSGQINAVTSITGA